MSDRKVSVHDVLQSAAMTSRLMLVFSLVGVLIALPARSNAECKAHGATVAAHVVELYTSEGCSSCPPAERWLRALSQTDPSVVTLEFHVDYWDSLGWRDRFADALYTRRQQRLAEESAQRVVYTPEVMLDGREWRNWTGQTVPATSSTTLRFGLDVTREPALTAKLALDSSASTAALEWYLAITEAELASSVTAGENRGTKLLHDNVVRAFAGPRPVSETIVVDHLSPDIDADHASAVALVVDAATSRAIAAERLSLARCAPIPAP
jgi:hypothetical protein